MKYLFLIGLVFILGFFVFQGTHVHFGDDKIIAINKEFRANHPITIGIIGNSKACGYRQTGWENLVEGGENIDSNGLLTQAGENNPNIKGWAQNLQRWLRQRNSNSIVYNFAGSGWTTQSHIDMHTVEALINKNPRPTIVFIQLNVNDRLKDTVEVFPEEGGMTWEGYLANTRVIIRKLLAASIVPILVKEDNQPLAGGKGWKWGEYRNTTTNEWDTHRPYSDYVAAYDTIAHDPEWGKPLVVLDAYTPTLNRGREPQYIYEGDPAPSDFRYSLTRASVDKKSNDYWHQNDKGGEIILKVYKDFFMSHGWI